MLMQSGEERDSRAGGREMQRFFTDGPLVSMVIFTVESRLPIAVLLSPIADANAILGGAR